MSHFAHVVNGIVQNIIVAEQDFIDTLENPSEWIQTSYNTWGGVHYDPVTRKPDGGIAFRKNYAIIGGIYDPELDAFYEPKPYNSWILNKDTCFWEAPVPHPNDGLPYEWNESTLTWDVLVDEQRIIAQQTAQDVLNGNIS